MWGVTGPGKLPVFMLRTDFVITCTMLHKSLVKQVFCKNIVHHIHCWYEKTTPVYAGAKQQCDLKDPKTDDFRISANSSVALIVQHLFEPRAEPALGLFCCLESLLVELVDSGVDLLAGVVELPLGLDLCLLVLLAGLNAVLVELLLGLLCFGLCLVGLLRVSNGKSLKCLMKTYVLLSC
jgi:hypothetical protein